MSDSPPIFQLVYASAATAHLGQQELEELLAVSRANNERLGVTGMLLYQDGSFLQALEGERSVVLALYQKILEDPRHSSSMLVYRGDVEERSFENWAMGFKRLGAAEAKSIPGLSDFLRSGKANLPAEAGLRIRSILVGFREGKWRRRAS